MASGLLKCSICPKRPSFSDVSHLLTHVGSKGHLSHLHKLQVRSHQELSAGHELAAYDRWYQQHGLGQLLSERMLQKESKKGSRRGRPTIQRQIKNDPEQQDIKTRIPAPSHRHSAVKTRQLHQIRPTKKLRLPNLDLDSDDDSDYDDSPTRQRGRRKARRVYKSPLKRSWSREDDHDSEADCPAVTDPVTPKAEDDSPKLKGVFWPGMDLFDAATEEMRRRRNQKKDGSALKNMERTSELVKPAEAIYSPGGTWQKTRVITGNVDDTSPLRGETPVPKPVRRRRQPLAQTDGNIPRTLDRKGKGRKRRTRTQGLKEMSRDASPYIESPSVAGSYRPASRFSPTEDENMEFKLTVGNLKDQKKRGNFAIFNDNGYARVQHQSQSLVSDLDGTRSRPPLSQSYTQQSTNRPQMQFMTTPWLQPQYQQQSASYQNMYTSIGQHSLQNGPGEGLGLGKENMEPGFAAAGRPIGYAKATPLAPAPVTAQDHFRSLQAPRLGGNFGLSGLNMFDDPFGYSTNPLSAAFQQMPNTLEAPFMTETYPYSTGGVINDTKGVISPDGTVSDVDGLDNAQHLFATSE